MPGRSPTGLRRTLRLLPEGVVVLVLVAAVVVLLVAPRGRLTPAPPRPLDLTLAVPGTAVPVAAAASHTVSRAAVARALRRPLRAHGFGRSMAVRVAALDGRVLFSSGSGRFTPASSLKLLTLTAVLAVLGPEDRFTTAVRRMPTGNRIVLVGGGDPTLSRTQAHPGGTPRPASLADLARRTASALRSLGRTSVRVGYDDSLFTGPALDPGWPHSYLTQGVVPPISALWVDEGASHRGGYVRDPALQAAHAFSAALRSQHIRVRGGPSRVTSLAGSAPLASVTSPPLAEIVQETLTNSDNNAAEVLGHQLGLAEGTGGSFAGGVTAVRRGLRRLGVDTSGLRLFDTSGLSRRDRVNPDSLVSVLTLDASPRQPTLRPVLTGLPVAGLTGTLASRFGLGSRAGRGRVQAKTGTLTGVSALAGVVTDVSGTAMLFVAMADRVGDTTAARDDLDKVASALAACHCG